MRKLKRLSSLLLAIVLVLSLSATAFAAIGDTGFSDVDADAWYAEAVTYCHRIELMYGTSETTFSPDESLTRSMLVTVLYRFAGSPDVTGKDNFSDTIDGAYYEKAVLWASQTELVLGYGNGLFGIDDPVTRQDMSVIFWRFMKAPSAGNAGDYTGRPDVSDYAVNAAAWACENGILTPASGGMSNLKGDASRAEVAAALLGLVMSAPQPEPEPKPEPDNKAKVLVAYFSATNTTKAPAEYIASGLNADIYAITPETPYTSADLNYGSSTSRSSIEMNDPNSRPAISGSVENMEQYDIIFLGYPIWWGQAPRIISTFLESYNFSGKTIVPFCTSGSSGIGSSAANLHSLTNNANWLDGRRFGGGVSSGTVLEWVNGLGLDLKAE